MVRKFRGERVDDYYFPREGDEFPTKGALLDALIDSDWGFETTGNVVEDGDGFLFSVDAVNRTKDTMLHIEAAPLRPAGRVIRIRKVVRSTP